MAGLNFFFCVLRTGCHIGLAIIDHFFPPPPKKWTLSRAWKMFIETMLYVTPVIHAVVSFAIWFLLGRIKEQHVKHILDNINGQVEIILEMVDDMKCQLGP